MMPRTLWFSALLIAAGCNSPSKPPVAKFTVQEAIAVIKPLEAVGRGCGIMSWNGSSFGMAVEVYVDAKTPWKWRTVDRLSYVYAETAQGRILTAIHVDGHEYRRDASFETHLTWRRYTSD